MPPARKEWARANERTCSESTQSLGFDRNYHHSRHLAAMQSTLHRIPTAKLSMDIEERAIHS